MIVGSASGPFAWLPIVIASPAGDMTPVEFAIDTGFTGYLALPASQVAALGLRYLHSMNVLLADGSEATLPVHEATIVWDGVDYVVRIYATGHRPLLGTALLAGHRLVAEFTEGGTVTVDML